MLYFQKVTSFLKGLEIYNYMFEYIFRIYKQMLLFENKD